MHTPDDTRKYNNIAQAPQFVRKNVYEELSVSTRAAVIHPNQ